MSTLLDFYKNKKILITGCTGFKGSWLTYILSLAKANIQGYSLNPPTEPSLWNILNLKEKISYLKGDVRDYQSLVKIFREFQPKIVFHLAAQPLVRYSYKEPKFTYETNVIGTLNVLEAIREIKSVKVFINVTSDKCYENKEWYYSYREIDTLGGYDPYSSSKACSEILTNSYICSFFNPNNFNKIHKTAIATVRAGNVIGGGDWQVDRLIPDSIKALSKGEKIIVRNPKAIRPWQHVLEPLFGYLLLAKKLWEEPLSFVGAWNFGPFTQNIAKVEDIVKVILKYWKKGEYTIERRNEFHENHFLSLDINKAIMKLGWKPYYNLEIAVKKTVVWYKNFYLGFDMEKITKRQVNNYLRLWK